ncbi:MAG: phosphoribosylglycinamide formyltransferase [Clostridia bacterium]|jgi:phosphoribosylglycinamide formyltransferase-1|nr:phosphoribosylglycinamide formyltransferase [Clostridiales bacterium]
MAGKSIAVLASGRGTNLQSLIDGINSGSIKNAALKLVVSDNQRAYALERAMTGGIEAIWINPQAYKGRGDYNDAIMEEFRKRDIDLVVLAGYMRILSAAFVRAYRDAIINVHPSLIPSFCGKGYYGERVHREALEYGVKVTGATVHFVDEGTDTGPIILQQAVEVLPGDTVDSLAKRVLQVEHTLLPRAVDLYCRGCLSIEGRRVIICGENNGGALCKGEH